MRLLLLTGLVCSFEAVTTHGEVVPASSDWPILNDEGITLAKQHFCEISYANNTKFEGGSLSCTSFTGEHWPSLASLGMISVVQVSCGLNHCCALAQATGVPSCWSKTLGVKIPTDEPMIQVSVGGDVACGILASNRSIACWPLAQKSSKHPVMQDLPSVAGGTEFYAVSCGLNFCCGIQFKQFGLVRCWGKEFSSGVAPLPNNEAKSQVSIAANGEYALALQRDSGLVVGWGKDNFGQVKGAPKETRFSQVTAAEHFACGIVQDTQALKCWGRITSLRLKEGLKGFQHGAATRFSHISSGPDTICARLVDDGANTSVKELVCFPQTVQRARVSLNQEKSL